MRAVLSRRDDHLLLQDRLSAGELALRGAGIALALAALFAAMTVLDQWGYWGQPTEHAVVRTVRLTGGTISQGRSSCDEAVYALTVTDPRPRFPVDARATDCSSEASAGDRVTLRRTGENPQLAYLNPIEGRELPWLALAFGAVGALVLGLLFLIQARWRSFRAIRGRRGDRWRRSHTPPAVDAGGHVRRL